MYGWMAGGEFMSADGRHCTLNDPGVVEGLTYMVDVYDALGGYDTVSAFEAGFQSLSQFNRVFRRVAGESPTTYRDRVLREA